jgi:hypothetical protein
MAHLFPETIWPQRDSGVGQPIGRFKLTRRAPMRNECLGPWRPQVNTPRDLSTSFFAWERGHTLLGGVVHYIPTQDQGFLVVVD